MGKQFWYYYGVFILIIWSLNSGCYYLHGNRDKAFYRGPEKNPIGNLKCDSWTSKEPQNYFEALVCHNQSKMRESEGFSAKKGEDNELRPVGFTLNAQEQEELLKKETLLLRFAWFSDTHIRQREVKLGSNWLSRKLHPVLKDIEHNFVQEDFNWAVYLSQIEATNKFSRNFRVDFMIHTGDSVDTGSIEELYQFIYISDQLEIPWINLVGNHDDHTFGNHNPRIGLGRDPNFTFYPIMDLEDFLWMHRSKREISGMGQYLLPVPVRPELLPPVESQKLPPTSHHGYDFKTSPGCWEKLSTRPNNEITGDYAVDLLNIPIRIRLIALNSSKTDKEWAQGELTHKQLEWLQCVLLDPGEGISLVFVHHRPGQLGSEAKALLRGTDDRTGKRTMVVFTGHDHSHNLQLPGGPKGKGHYELNTGSGLEFPQIGRIIELRRWKGQVYLVSRALWSRPMELIPLIKNKQIPSLNAEEVEFFFLQECENSRRPAKMENFDEAVKCGHYGAYADVLKKHKKPADLLEEWWGNVNVIIKVMP